ncbi:MAG: hypothetical protein HDR98_07475 [Bacteroides sp.]|nr:hypothetical protein [Bacteroides sp.]MBD5338944.1 hypothetical protein [Bacteroides sp.]
MKSILLIDDNSKMQRQSYGASFVDGEVFESILHHIECVNKDFDLSILDKYSCVMIHDSLEDFINGSFDENSHVAKDLIIEYLDDHQIPYVLFSDGHESTGVYDLSHNLVNLKKSDFYSRLRYFLDFYMNESVLQFHILAYGSNFRKALVTRHIKALFQKFDTKNPNDIITVRDLKPSNSEEEHYLEKIINLSQPALGLDYNDILDYIDDNEISVRDFKLKINNILSSISKYGKNTYTWE